MAKRTTLYNHKILMEFLLDEGMGMEAEGVVETPLRTVCLLNCQSIARLLLHRGVEINACGVFGDALQAAAMKGHTTVVKLMIDEGANINQQSGFYGTALQAAAYHGQHGAVEVLLDAGADVHAMGYCRDAFHAAAEGGHPDVIMLMLQKGYKFCLPPEGRRCRIHVPSRCEALMRDASPDRNCNRYGRRKSFWASKDISAKATRPTIELEAIFRTAENGSEMAQLKTEEVLVIEYRLPLYSRRKNYPLEAAFSVGHVATVKLLLEQRDVLGISNDEISHAIKVSASNSHWPVVQLLLDDVAKGQSIKSYIETILEVGPQGPQSQIVDFALVQVSKHCHADETAELKPKLITTTNKYHHDSKVSQETLIADFAESYKNGNVQIIDAILGSKHHEALSSREIDAGLQLCAMNDQSIVAQMLLESPLLKGRRPTSGEEAFFVTADSGSVKMMKLLIFYWTDELTSTSSVAVIRALVISSSNGHIDVMRYLVQDMSADINNLAHDKPVESDLNKRLRASSSFASVSYDSKGQSQASEEEFIEVSVISLLQAALRGFVRFNYSRSHFVGIPFESLNKSKKGEQPQHEEVIMFFLDSGSKFNDLGGQNIYPIQLTAKFCSDDIVGRFILADADVNAIKDDENALFAATGRELSAAPIVRTLLAAGATIPEEVQEQKKLLEQALRYFPGTNDYEGRFSAAPSLKYMFNKGSGAVLFDLLHQMPQITTTDIKWTLILQMAAFFDNHLFVELLLSPGTDVNAIGHHYGTALEAAVRCGHISMIQKLLNVGAEVNMLHGRWQTALRATFIEGHADVVETLLEHGADMELGCTLKKASETALQLAVKSGNLSTVKALLKRGANAVLDESETLHPLILASKQGSVAMVTELLSAGAPVNVHGKKRFHFGNIDDEDASPVHAAIAGGYLDVTRLLVSQGADVGNNIEGVCTSLTLAAYKNRTDIVRLLLSVGANVINDDVALSHVIRHGSIEIAQQLLAAGLKAESVLVLACRQRFLPVIELLLEKIYDGENPETVINEVFAIDELDDFVSRLLLEYTSFTMRRFVQVCAAGSAASLEIMLDKGGIDINEQGEANGDYSLQVAASHLQAEVVRFLLSNGADVNCKSSKHGTPLMTVLESCAACTLQTLKSEKAKELVDKLFLPNFGCEMIYHSHSDSFSDSALSRFQQLSDCEKIVRLLVTHGADTIDDSRPFGPPLHLACLLGSKVLVELFL